MEKSWGEIKEDFIKHTKEKLGHREAESIFRWIFDHFTSSFVPTPESLRQKLTKDEWAAYENIKKRVMQGEPIQYILGTTYFGDVTLHVDKNVLIPRQETEELIAWIHEEEKAKLHTQILDVGTGSGAIAISLAKMFPNTKVIGTDISENALRVAQSNAERNQVSHVQFEHDDISNSSKTFDPFSMIVSNPPYVDREFSKSMQKEVLDWEPHIALFAPEDNVLFFYENIAKFGMHNLVGGGVLYLEINEFYVKETEQVLKNVGYHSIEAKKDLNNNWRFIRAFSPE